MRLDALLAQNGLRGKLLRGVNSGSVKKAESMLSPGEEAIFAVLCNASVVPVKGKLTLAPVAIKNKVAGIFVVTGSRLLWCTSVLGSGSSSMIRINDITSIDDAYNALLQMATVRIQGLTEMFVLDLAKKEYHALLAAVEQARCEATNPSTPAPASISPSGDYTTELERLADLHAEGVLTDEEFTAKKKQLLGI